MLACPTCATENDDFATICVQCKSFLQNRVPNLNLFETAWGMIESPRATFRTITLSEHKNYVVFLFCFLGIAVSFTTFWYLELGRLFDSLLFMLPWAIGFGVLLGIASAPIVPLIVHSVARLFGSRQKFRNTFAMVGYALIPIVLSLILVLPIELLTFGMYLFTSNPSPLVIKPLSFLMLVGFDGTMAVWTLVLTVIGLRVVHGFSISRAAWTVAGSLTILGGMYFLSTERLLLALRG